MPTANLLGVVVGKLSRAHVTISERSDPLIYTYGIRGTLRKYLYRYADKLVVQTDHIRKYYSAYMSNNKIEIQLDNNPNNLQNGTYLLFVLNSKGTPSEGKIVFIN